MHYFKSRLFRFLLLAAIGIIIPFHFGNLVQANEQSEAKKIVDDVKITISSGEDSSFLTDEYKSGGKKLKLEKGTTIKISSKEKFNRIYIIWDKPMSEWSLTANNKIIECGQNGFIHELVEIDGDVTTATMTIPNDGVIINEIELYTDGRLPSDVQVWTPPYERADMLLLPTHADDEFLFFGGTMPYYAGELGLKVQVAYITNHFQYDWERMRPHEMLNGLWSAGVTAYPVIGEFPDIAAWTLESAKSVYNENEMLEFQVELIRRFKPMVIIGHDLDGEYGHGVHMLNAHTLVDALEISNDETKFEKSAEKYGAWDVPKTYLHLYEENKIVMEWDTPLTKFDGKTGFEMAVIGLDFHKSQLQYYEMSKKGVYDCRAFGLYRTTVGDDVLKNDFLENITLYVEPEPEPEPEPESQVDIDSSVIENSSENDSTAQAYQSTNESSNQYGMIKYLFIAVGILSATILFIFIRGRIK